MRAAIVNKLKNDETLNFSAEELARYLKRLLPEKFIKTNNRSDEELFTICLDLDGGTEEENDRFSVQIGPRGGSIIGVNSRSVLLGVYDYLHNLGCRFLGPCESMEVLPEIREEELPASYTKTASYKHRGVCIEGAESLENMLAFVDWLPKLGYNSFFLQYKIPYTFFDRWYSHENNPLRAPESFTVEDAAEYMRLVEAAMKKRGLLLHKAGHGWTGEALGYSTLGWMEADHPLPSELVPMTALVGGRRGLYENRPANTNLCLSNPDAMQAFEDLVVDYAMKNPEVDYLHLWLADACNNVCECDECSRTTPSDLYVTLLNHIDERLTQAGLSTRIVFLLYLELLWPPVKARLRNPDRFVLMFAPISRTFKESYQLDKKPGTLPVYQRNQIRLPVDLRENMDFLNAWQALFEGDSFVYDYPLGRAHYGDFGYTHIARIINEDIRKLHQMGLNGYISCQEIRIAMPNALPGYVMGRTLFDETIEIDSLYREYFEAAYSKEWETVLRYLKAVSARCDCDYFIGKGPRPSKDIAENLAALPGIVESFAPVIRAHRRSGETWDSIFWALLDYHGQYVTKLAAAVRQIALDNPDAAWDAWSSFRDFICEMEPQFQEYLDVYRILEVTSKYSGFSV